MRVRVRIVRRRRSLYERMREITRFALTIAVLAIVVFVPMCACYAPDPQFEQCECPPGIVTYYADPVNGRQIVDCRPASDDPTYAILAEAGDRDYCENVAPEDIIAEGNGDICLDILGRNFR